MVETKAPKPLIHLLKPWRFMCLGFLFSAIAGCNTAPQQDLTTEKPSASTSDAVEIYQPPKGGLTDELAPSFLTKFGKTQPKNEVIISTAMGDITIRLYHNTPLHRANFLFLTQQNYYTNTWFYRVSEGHVIQAGHTDESETLKKRYAIGKYRIPAEIKEGNWHKYGAVAAARSYKNNPHKLTDPFEFYIVLGKKYSAVQLNLLADKHNFNLSASQKELYSNQVGSPHLDGQHTVFGEVISGMDVVEKISRVPVDEGEWPLDDIPIKVYVKP